MELSGRLSARLPGGVECWKDTGLEVSRAAPLLGSLPF